jgi:chromosome segregation ATPase
MDFEAALEAIKKLEGGEALAAVIKTHLTKLDEKIYQVIGEKRTAGSKAQNLEAVVTAIAKTLGVEGDLDAALNTLESKVKTVVDEHKSAQTKVSDLETRATTAETKATGLERQGKITQAATKAGADAKVLERLLGDKVDELAIADDGVKIGDKPLREYVEAAEDLKPFIPALFPNQQQAKPQVKLPNGSPKGQAPEAEDLYAKATGRSNASWIGKKK